MKNKKIECELLRKSKQIKSKLFPRINNPICNYCFKQDLHDDDKECLKKIKDLKDFLFKKWQERKIKILKKSKD